MNSSYTGAAAAYPQGARGRANPLQLAWARKYDVAVFVLPLTLYAFSMSTQPASWDTAELQAVPYLLGIAHPTGFPLYTLLGFVFSHLVPLGTVAFRLNFFSAMCVSAGCVALYRITREFSVPRACGALGALWFAVAATIWTHAIRAEAHDLVLALSLLCTLFAIRWVKDGRSTDLRLGAGAFGLALATHPVAIWLFPGLVLALVLRRPPWTEVRFGAIVVVAAVSLYLYLPLRSAIVDRTGADPTLHLAGVKGGLIWNYNNPSTWSGFVAEISGSQFGAGSAVLRVFSPDSLQTYLADWVGAANADYGALGLVLALFGLARLWSVQRKPMLVLLVLTLMAVPFSYAYSGVEADPDRYRLLSMALPAILMSAAAIADRQWQGLYNFLRAGAVFALMLIWSVTTLFNNDGTFGYRTSGGSRGLITAVAKDVPRGAVVVTPWLDATSLAYGAYVDGSFASRIVVAGWSNTYSKFYASWSKTHPVYVLSPTRPAAPPFYTFHRSATIDGGHSVWVLQRRMRLHR